MANIQVGLVIGSLRKDSFNRKMGLAMRHLLPARFVLDEIGIGDVPLFSQDLEASPPASVLELRKKIHEKQALIFITPEYNRSIPGVLKNALDWGSRPYGQNAWAGKPAAICGTSPGAVGTAIAQQHLRGILGYLDVPTQAQPEIFLQYKDGLIDADGRVPDDRTRAFLQKFADRYTQWVDGFLAKV